MVRFDPMERREQVPVDWLGESESYGLAREDVEAERDLSSRVVELERENDLESRGLEQERLLLGGGGTPMA